MLFSDLREKIIDPVADKPQLVGLANYHLDNLKAALDGLDNLGYKIEVVFSSGSAPLQYPKMLYRDIGENYTVENSTEEMQALKDGWRQSISVVIDPKTAYKNEKESLATGQVPIPEHKNPTTTPARNPEPATTPNANKQVQSSIPVAPGPPSTKQ
jgi:hypothetical protein